MVEQLFLIRSVIDLANMHLVTGYGGEEHVTADDQASFHVRMLGETLGSGQYVLNIGNKLSASIVTNNQVRVLDGEILMQGRYIRIPSETYVDLDIENGAQSVQRNDLIVARYTKDVVTGVEAVNLVVIKGEAAESNPSDPAYIVGDLLNDHALQADMPLYRLFINGLTAETLTPLFTLYDSTVDELKATDAKKQERTDLLTLASTIANDDQIPIFEASGSKHKKVKFKTINDLLASYSKDEVLSAATKTLFGLGADAVPNDAFNWIGKFNQYWWTALDISYTAFIGDAYTINLTRATSASIKTTINYSSQIEVSSTGELSLVNPSSGEFYSSAYSDANSLKGKYIQGAFENTSAIFYIAEDAPDASRYVSGDYVYIRVTASMVSSVNPNTSRYVNSANRNMYPDCGEQDGTEYRFIGIPFSNLLSSSKIEKGSYIGTGIYSSSNPVCITTSRKPVIIFVKTRETVYSTSPFMILFPFIYDENYGYYSCFMSYYSSGNVNGLYGYAKIVDNSVYFYDTSSTFLSFNKAQIKYEWIAICGTEDIE